MLQERRLFSIATGSFLTLVFDVLKLQCTEEVAIVFNDRVVSVYPDDTANDVIARWNEKTPGKMTDRFGGPLGDPSWANYSS